MILTSLRTQSELQTPELRELEKRMQKPQRHRLLHGYPLAAAMPRIPETIRAADSSFRLSSDSDRGLLVGVLPHSFCNPTVRGCGFCTFPQESYGKLKAAAVVRGVLAEIDQRFARELHLHGRTVSALYIGGATANLTPEKPFRDLCRKLNDSFDLSNAEITLEGVPIHFVRRQPLLIDVMREELNARHFRISMGLQTFDRQRLEQMGRLAFGTRPVFEEVVQAAHQRHL